MGIPLMEATVNRGYQMLSSSSSGSQALSNFARLYAAFLSPVASMSPLFDLW